MVPPRTLLSIEAPWSPAHAFLLCSSHRPPPFESSHPRTRRSPRWSALRLQSLAQQRRQRPHRPPHLQQRRIHSIRHNRVPLPGPAHEHRRPADPRAPSLSVGPSASVRIRTPHRRTSSPERPQPLLERAPSAPIEMLETSESRPNADPGNPRPACESFLHKAARAMTTLACRLFFCAHPTLHKKASPRALFDSILYRPAISPKDLRPQSWLQQQLHLQINPLRPRTASIRG